MHSHWAGNDVHPIRREMIVPTVLTRLILEINFDHLGLLAAPRVCRRYTALLKVHLKPVTRIDLITTLVCLNKARAG